MVETLFLACTLFVATIRIAKVNIQNIFYNLQYTGQLSGKVDSIWHNDVEISMTKVQAL